MNPLSLLSSLGSAATSLFGGLQGYLIVGAVSGLLAASGGAWVGYNIEYSKLASLQLADAQAQVLAVNKAIDRRTAQDAAALKAAVSDAQAQQKIVTVTQTITKRIPGHDTVLVEAHACIPVALERLLRATATEADPDSLALAPGQSDDDCADLTVADVADWFASYAGASEANAQQLTDLQQWVRDDHAAQETHQ